MRIAKANLKQARRQLATILVSGYKNASPQVEVYVLGATSVSNLVDRIDFVSRSNNSQRDVLEQIHTSELQIKRHQAQLIAARRQAKHLVKTRAAQAHEVQSSWPSSRHCCNSIKGDIAASDRPAAGGGPGTGATGGGRAAAAAAAAAAAPPQVQTPTTTSSGGDGGGGVGSVPIPPAGSVGEQAVQIAEQSSESNTCGAARVRRASTAQGSPCGSTPSSASTSTTTPAASGTKACTYPESQLAPGDLVFFEPTLGHVGMYIGNGAFIHAPHTGTVVQISSLSDPWYSSEYQGAVRVTG